MPLFELDFRNVIRPKFIGEINRLKAGTFLFRFSGQNVKPIQGCREGLAPNLVRRPSEAILQKVCRMSEQASAVRLVAVYDCFPQTLWQGGRVYRHGVGVRADHCGGPVHHHSGRVQEPHVDGLARHFFQSPCPCANAGGAGDLSWSWGVSGGATPRPGRRQLTGQRPNESGAGCQF